MEDVVVDFIEAFKFDIHKLKIGDPMDEETDIGPLAKKEFVHSLKKVLKNAKKKGARSQTHGKKYGKGFSSILLFYSCS